MQKIMNDSRSVPHDKAKISEFEEATMAQPMMAQPMMAQPITGHSPRRAAPACRRRVVELSSQPAGTSRLVIFET